MGVSHIKVSDPHPSSCAATALPGHVAVNIHQQIFESSSTQTSYPVLCTCKMVQGSGRYHLESVGLCFVGDDLPFSGGFCFASVCIAGAVVAELYFLYREKVIGFQVRVCSYSCKPHRLCI